MQPLTIIDDPSAWLASDYPDPAKLAYVLTAEDITELDAGIAAVIASGKEIQVYWTLSVEHSPRILQLQNYS